MPQTPIRDVDSLRALEKLDQFLFHGSALCLSGLEPRQAYTMVDGETRADGEPAIFSTSLLNYAIFMAVVSRENCPAGMRASFGSNERGEFVYSASAHTMSQITDASRGFVHVFDRAHSSWIPRGITEWVSYVGQTPVAIYEVYLADFTASIHPLIA